MSRNQALMKWSMHTAVSIFLQSMLLVSTATSATNEIGPGAFVTNAITTIAQTNVYGFQALANGRVNIVLVVTSGPGVPEIRVHDPAGTLVTNVTTPTILIENLKLTNAGCYTFSVHERGGRPKLRIRLEPRLAYWH